MLTSRMTEINALVDYVAGEGGKLPTFRDYLINLYNDLIKKLDSLQAEIAMNSSDNTISSAILEGIARFKCWISDRFELHDADSRADLQKVCTAQSQRRRFKSGPGSPDVDVVERVNKPNMIRKRIDVYIDMLQNLKRGNPIDDECKYKRASRSMLLMKNTAGSIDDVSTGIDKQLFGQLDSAVACSEAFMKLCIDSFANLLIRFRVECDDALYASVQQGAMTAREVTDAVSEIGQDVAHIYGLIVAVTKPLSRYLSEEAYTVDQLKADSETGKRALQREISKNESIMKGGGKPTAMGSLGIYLGVCALGFATFGVGFILAPFILNATRESDYNEGLRDGQLMQQQGKSNAAYSYPAYGQQGKSNAAYSYPAYGQQGKSNTGYPAYGQPHAGGCKATRKTKNATKTTTSKTSQTCCAKKSAVTSEKVPKKTRNPKHSVK